MQKDYPIPKVERKNKEYAYLLLQDYAGEISEDTAVHLYSYEQFVTPDMEEFRHLLAGIAVTEMKHLKLLGETIWLLGVDPRFHTIESITRQEVNWNSGFVPYSSQILEMIAINIEAEKKAILKYELHKNIISDRYIQKLLERIIEDEKEHIRLFEQFKKDYILRN